MDPNYKRRLLMLSCAGLVAACFTLQCKTYEKLENVGLKLNKIVNNERAAIKELETLINFYSTNTNNKTTLYECR